jgi:undecaprenyl-diphosphatase
MVTNLEKEIEIIILGLIQGLTEWLPISSTGHMKLAEYFLGLKLPLLFYVVLHIGTLLVTVIFFREDIKRILIALIKLDFKSNDGTMAQMIIIGSFPTMLIGLLVSSFSEEIFSNILLIAVSFIFSGLMVYISKIGKERKKRVDWKSAILIGIAQGFSTMPGLSRSGLTIATALILGIKRDEAFKFSFLLSIPSIFGALTLTIYTRSGVLLLAEVESFDLLVGTLISMIVGYMSIKILRRVIRKFHMFALYSLLLGSSIVIFEFLFK